MKRHFLQEGNTGGGAMAPGSVVEAEIQDVGYRGSGVARVGGKVVFIPGVLPGERVRARVVRDGRDYAIAGLQDVVTASPHRIEPRCPLASVCPGCVYQHVAYEEEIRIKHLQFTSFLKRKVPGAGEALRDPVASPVPDGYRNKIVLHGHVDGHGRRLGYVAEDNRTIVDVPACPLASPPINDALAGLRADVGFMRAASGRRTVTLRHTPHDGVVHFFGIEGEGLPWLTESTAVGEVQVPAGSFFQVNPGLAGRLTADLVERMCELALPSVVDLYCGVGVFGLAAAKAGARRVAGVDSDAAAVRAASRNAAGKEGAFEWVTASAEEGLRVLVPGLDAARTVVLLDPPRAGLEAGVLEFLLEWRPAQLVYISCAADTLARDAGRLVEGGYRVKDARLYDMFPRTAYFESVVGFAPGG